MKLLKTALVLLLVFTTALTVAAEKPSRVTVAEVIKQNLLEEVPLPGSAEPLQVSEISPRVAGVVKQVFVEEGDKLETGQEILVLDSVIAELEVASVKASLSEAIARHKDAVRQKQEYQSLIKNNAVATTSLASAVADEEAARAVIAKQRAELERLEEMLSRHVLTAPFSGIIADKHVEVGQWVKADSSVVNLVALDRMRVRVSVPQRYFQRINKTSPVRITFDSLPGKTFHAKASTLVAVGNQSTRSFPLLIDLDNAQQYIAAGMSARVFIELADQQKPSLLVPVDTVILKADGSRHVWQVIQDNNNTTVKSVKVITGRSKDGLVEVIDSSLKPGDRIVLLGNENLRPGQHVLISQAK